MVRVNELGRLRGLAVRTYRSHGINVKSCRKLLHQHNTSFRVERADGTVEFLRLSRATDRSLTAVEAELNWITALTKAGFPVPKPIEWRPGVMAVESEGRVLTRFRWVEGQVCNAPSESEWRTIGRVIAELQIHAAQNPDLGVGRWIVDAMVGNGNTEAQALADVRDHFGTLAEADVIWLKDLYAARRHLLGPVQLLHGDVHQHNVMFHEGKATVLDFDDCGFGPRWYDLAVPIREIREDGLAGAESALLEGYASVLPLPPEFEEQLDLLLIWRGVQLVMWAIGEREKPEFAEWWKAWSQDRLDELNAFRFRLAGKSGNL